MLPAQCSVLVVLVLVLPAYGLDRVPWDARTKVGPDAAVPGWYINLGLTGARAKLTPDDPKALQVMYVFEGTPAFGKLQKGDRIVGANGHPFVTPHKFGYGMGKFGYEGPMMDLGNALEESQGKLGGRLVLDVVRGGEDRKVEMRLTTKYGAYSPTYPFHCKKSDVIFKEICGYLRKEQHRDGFWSDRPHINAYAALTLLSSGDPADLPAVKRCVMKMGRSLDGVIRPGGLPVWEYSLYGITLGEYYLATREEWVVPEMEKINRWLVKAQHPATGPPGEERHIPGGFGHAPHFVGGQNGYGSFNIVTAQAMIAWDLFARCGLSIDTDRFAAAHTFIAKGTNKIGYVWYADAVGGAGYADMGRTGASAVAHYLYPLPNEGYKAFALHNARCIGEHPLTFPDTHGCPLLGMAWTAPGAAIDPQSFRQLMDYNRWSFSLAQCPDGTFYYQPNRDNNTQDYVAAPRLSATAATGLVLAIKEHRLQITGATPIALPALKPAAATKEKAVAAKKLRLLVVAGGHGYKVPQFRAIFKNYPDIECTFVEEKQGGEAFEDISKWPYDAVLLYNYMKKPTDKQFANFLALTDRGVGLVILHHAIYGYRPRPEFRKIVGVTSWLSGEHSFVTMKMHVEDPKHPLTRGLADFSVHDETYIGAKLDPGDHVLLTTDEPKNSKAVAWVHTYRKSPVCYFQLGHAESAYTNPGFIAFLGRAIHWAAGEPAEQQSAPSKNDRAAKPGGQQDKRARLRHGGAGGGQHRRGKEGRIANDQVGPVAEGLAVGDNHRPGLDVDRAGEAVAADVADGAAECQRAGPRLNETPCADNRPIERRRGIVAAGGQRAVGKLQEGTEIAG